MTEDDWDLARLRLVRNRGDKVVRGPWTADVEPGDRKALAEQFLTAVRAELPAVSRSEAKRFLPDYRLEIFARVGGWTRVKGVSDAQA